ncbi:MAG: hypothetical protein WBG50_04600 [Desulfomonilaceae bacterium]
MKRIKVLFGRHEFHLLIFCLSVVLFSWPLISSSDLDHIDAMFVYLFVCWTVVIFLQFLISRVLLPPHSSQPTDDSDQ